MWVGLCSTNPILAERLGALRHFPLRPTRLYLASGRSSERPREESQIKWGSVQKELAAISREGPLDRAVLLLHTPPYDTPLDRAALDGKTYEHVPLDVHVRSIAVAQFIEKRQPLLTLHGHVHESARLSGKWKTRIGRTVSINGAHDGSELALVRFDLEFPWEATRKLL